MRTLLFCLSLITTIDVNAQQAVDLGLPSGTLWANTNIGASTPYEVGDAFKWANIVGDNKDVYYKSVDSTYVDAYGNTVTETKFGWTKYVLEEYAHEYGFDGFYDNKTTLEPEDDAATVNWGEGWSVPNADDCHELTQNCVITPIVINGIKLIKVTGPNGNYIYLYANNIYGVHYWTNECWSNSISTLYVSSDDLNFGNHGLGRNMKTNSANGYIRPVKKTANKGEENKICATPTISYSNKELIFNSETEGAEYHYTITDSDIKANAHSQDGKVNLTVAYNISVWASAEGYTNSETATTTLYFIDAALQDVTGIAEISAKRGIIVSSDNSILTVNGLNNGEMVQAYTLQGMKLTQARAFNGSAQLQIAEPQKVVILKVGNESIKVQM